MVLEKKRLSFDEIEAQTALELPDREMMLVTVVIGAVNVVDVVDVVVANNNIAVQVCAIVEAIDVTLLGANVLTCDIQQNHGGGPIQTG